VQVSGPAFAGDAEYEMRRLLRLHVSDAAEQLEAGGVQGFVVFSREESGLLENHMRALSQAVRDNREKTLSSVMGLIAYDTNVDKFSRVVASARIHLKSEARSLCSDLSLLGRGGRVDLRLF
jgi:hypothetical protein